MLCICAVFYRKWSFQIQQKERIKKFGKIMVFGQAYLAKKMIGFPMLFKAINKNSNQKNLEENIEDDELGKEVHEKMVVRETEIIKLKQKD